jgi:2-methylfumaryl-CoA hydratase
MKPLIPLATHLYQNDAKLHFNAHQMKASPFKRRLVYGGHVISLCRSIAHEGFENNLMMTAIHAGTHSNPVLADDTLYAKTVITGKHELPDHQDIGVLKLKLIGIKNQIPSSLKSIYQENVESKIYNKNVVLDLDYSIVVPKGK